MAAALRSELEESLSRLGVWGLVVCSRQELRGRFSPRSAVNLTGQYGHSDEKRAAEERRERLQREGAAKL